MAHETADLHTTGSVFVADKWAGAIGSWFRARHGKYNRNREIRHLLSCDEKWLDDVGAPRAELVRELGYDPREMPTPYRAGMYRYPYF